MLMCLKDKSEGSNDLHPETLKIEIVRALVIIVEAFIDSCGLDDSKGDTLLKKEGEKKQRVTNC